MFASLKTTTTATSLAPGTIGRDGGDILNATNLHSRSRESAQRRLGARAWCLGAVATGCTQLDVQCSDTNVLTPNSNILGGKHSRVRRRLVTVSLHLHSTCHSDKCFTAG